MRTLIAFALAFLPAIASAETIVSVTGGQSHASWHGQADLQALNVEMGRAVSPRTDIAFVVAPMNLWQPRSWFGDQFGDGHENVRAISGSLLIRRRFNIDSSRVQWYAEALSGPMWAEKAVPASTSRFNFVSQAGFGAVLRPRARWPVIAGYRFMHISNGGYSPRNPGMNVSSLTLGVQLRR
ncbi:MAG TPA: acyloxyacyl hydrolase [Thermoanaerobaculia bacterium]|nr:acyloxyacyl hydrolase [Thermoanaerobaculia bacterium]